LTPILESLEAADALIRAGKVRYLGVCNQFAWKLTQACMMARASGLPRVICAQYQYNPVCRGIENEHIDLFEAFGISLIPWSPLAGGLLSGKYKEGSSDFRFDAAPSLEDSRESRLTGANLRVLETITAIANSRGNTAAQIALAWLLKKRIVGSIAIGARTPQQLDDNLGALSINLTAEDMSAIDRAGAPAPAYPYDFIRKARPGARSAFVQGQASAL
jgi:aryl-alcohol dehydrogenase-like predicted oxidoreductase